MPVYAYRGYKDGRRVRGIIDADSKKIAIQVLRKEGIIPVFVSEERRKGGRRVTFERISRRDVAVFSRQLASLLRSGVPLADALDAISRQTKGMSMRRVVISLRESIKEGKSFAFALGEYSSVFPRIYTGMVRAGEASGALEHVMEELANYIESQANIRSKILSASIYPALVFMVMAAVVSLLLTFVIPKIARILEDAGQSLPFYTSALIFVSDLMRKSLPYFIVVVAVGLFWRRRITSNPKVRIAFDTLKLKIPVFSRLHLNSCLHRFFSTLATLTRAGVPIATSLEICSEIAGNEVIRRAILNAKEKIMEGGTLWDELSSNPLFPPMVVHMVAVGERSGDLEGMFGHISRTLETEIETMITTLTSLLEPILVVFMGGLVFFIMLSILIPIFQINRTIM